MQNGRSADRRASQIGRTSSTLWTIGETEASRLSGVALVLLCSGLAAACRAAGPAAPAALPADVLAEVRETGPLAKGRFVAERKWLAAEQGVGHLTGRPPTGPRKTVPPGRSAPMRPRPAPRCSAPTWNCRRATTWRCSVFALCPPQTVATATAWGRSRHGRCRSAVAGNAERGHDDRCSPRWLGCLAPPGEAVVAAGARRPAGPLDDQRRRLPLGVRQPLGSVESPRDRLLLARRIGPARLPGREQGLYLLAVGILGRRAGLFRRQRRTAHDGGALRARIALPGLWPTFAT